MKELREKFAGVYSELLSQTKIVFNNLLDKCREYDDLNRIKEETDSLTAQFKSITIKSYSSKDIFEMTYKRNMVIVDSVREYDLLRHEKILTKNLESQRSIKKTIRISKKPKESE